VISRLFFWPVVFGVLYAGLSPIMGLLCILTYHQKYWRSGSLLQAPIHDHSSHPNALKWRCVHSESFYLFSSYTFHSKHVDIQLCVDCSSGLLESWRFQCEACLTVAFSYASSLFIFHVVCVGVPNLDIDVRSLYVPRCLPGSLEIFELALMAGPEFAGRVVQPKGRSLRDGKDTSSNSR